MLPPVASKAHTVESAVNLGKVHMNLADVFFTALRTALKPPKHLGMLDERETAGPWDTCVLGLLVAPHSFLPFSGREARPALDRFSIYGCTDLQSENDGNN